MFVNRLLLAKMRRLKCKGSYLLPYSHQTRGVDPLLGQRRRLCLGIKPALGQRHVAKLECAVLKT